QVAVHIEKREMCFQSPQVLLDCLKAWPEFKAE
ncbi:MAG: acyl-CoA thioesterase, partial [Acinetobacter sp.]